MGLIFTAKSRKDVTKGKDFTKERESQIEELLKWAEHNTSYNNISSKEAIKFFDSDKENLTSDLDYIFKIFTGMVNWAQSNFNVGKFTASEYANVVILKKTEGHDVEKIRKQIEEESIPLIKPTLSKTSKISILQNTVSEILKESSQNEISQEKLIEELVNLKHFEENDAKESIEKALKMGLLTSPKPNYVSL